MDWDTLIKNLDVSKKVKKNSDTVPLQDISLSEESKNLLEKSKLPFETTDDFVNRLIRLQNNFYTQRGKEFIENIFNDIFLQCSGDYLLEYDSNTKKVKVKDKMRDQIKKSIYNLFESSDDDILTLLLLIDESITLLLQTDFFDLVSKHKQQFDTDQFEEKEKPNFIS